MANGVKSEWTIATYAAHNEALRLAEEKFQNERDLRYAEVNTEKEKAVAIKETADKAALDLARQIQTYKDEKANELRQQINTERVTYASKTDLVALTEKLEAVIRPLTKAEDRSQGRGLGLNAGWGYLMAAITTGALVYAAVQGTHTASVPAVPSIIYMSPPPVQSSSPTTTTTTRP